MDGLAIPVDGERTDQRLPACEADEDLLAPARGIILAVVLAALFWAGLAWSVVA